MFAAFGMSGGVYLLLGKVRVLGLQADLAWLVVSSFSITHPSSTHHRFLTARPSHLILQPSVSGGRVSGTRGRLHVSFWRRLPYDIRAVRMVPRRRERQLLE